MGLVWVFAVNWDFVLWVCDCGFGFVVLDFIWVVLGLTLWID